ncbi:Crp/Fnr family transcriptional regulator [Acidipropionibacterium acidipropionici]|uniref:Transcriptional regulator n=1 Tax=Acidipropionibacterium acidipropionici TaxID=1748 RepID=A0AAC8YF22_9ACTN|nr:Crp/Fnr family transcriptional regulator [Acidipropionibacterium acidipropionici]AMS05345.1 transcriptional regulator [Acidipropionibacterium acidipropionici]AOZ46821.1 transcriptional regulator [Acidipropionibacterium acidipropionici]AZP37101.1 Crp/Fnr family transcriptional regulator [Acidipropionibacterium acidipropionici]
MTNVVATAATQPFLSMLNANSTARIISLSEVMVCSRGSVLFEAGDPAADLFLVVEGKVKLTRPTTSITSPHRESLLWLMGPGDMFGELSLVDGGTRSTTATTLTRASLLRVPGHDLEDLVESRHDVALALLGRMSERLRRSDNTTAHFVVGDVPSRLAFILIDLAERFGRQDPTTGHIVVRHDLTQLELAQAVGSSRETVNKALTDFTQREWITARPWTVTILDLEKLRMRTST